MGSDCYCLSSVAKDVKHDENVFPRKYPCHSHCGIRSAPVVSEEAVQLRNFFLTRSCVGLFWELVTPAQLSDGQSPLYRSVFAEDSSCAGSFAGVWPAVSSDTMFSHGR